MRSSINIRVVKAKRVGRKLLTAWWRLMKEPLFNSGQLLTGLVGVLGLAIYLQYASPEERDVQAAEWAVAVQAFALALAIWAIISLIRAPLLIVREDREKGTWIGKRRLYYQPQLVSVSIWTPDDTDKCVSIMFDDAEDRALVRYRIELDPPVPGRFSAYLERQPGEMDGIFGSIRGSPSGTPGKAGGTGSIGMVGREAFLRVKLDPQTVAVTARVYMTDFSLAEVVL